MRCFWDVVRNSRHSGGLTRFDTDYFDVVTHVRAKSTAKSTADKKHSR